MHSGNHTTTGVGTSFAWIIPDVLVSTSNLLVHPYHLAHFLRAGSDRHVDC